LLDYIGRASITAGERNHAAVERQHPDARRDTGRNRREICAQLIARQPARRTLGDRGRRLRQRARVVHEGLPAVVGQVARAARRRDRDLERAEVPMSNPPAIDLLAGRAHGDDRSELPGQDHLLLGDLLVARHTEGLGMRDTARYQHEGERCRDERPAHSTGDPSCHSSSPLDRVR
jgi:hypothetical protein